MGLVQIFPTVSLGAVGCRRCSEQLNELAKEVGRKERLDKLMTQNKNFIQKYANKFPKQTIKVKSNIVVLSIKLETAVNHIESQVAELKKIGCDGCYDELLKSAQLPMPSPSPSETPASKPSE